MGVDQQLARRLLIFHESEQEISDALAGQLSNEDEDEVEDELERMEKESSALPKVSSHALPNDVVQDVRDDIGADHDMPDVPTSIASQDTQRLQKQKERAKVRKVALHA